MASRVTLLVMDWVSCWKRSCSVFRYPEHMAFARKHWEQVLGCRSHYFAIIYWTCSDDERTYLESPLSTS